MTNKELIINLLDTNLNAETDLKKTIGHVTFKPVVTAKWVKDNNNAVFCSRCGCRVSKIASANMNYCFICGAEMEKDV